MRYIPYEIFGANGSLVYLYWIIGAVVIGLIVGAVIWARYDGPNGVAALASTVILAVIPLIVLAYVASYTREVEVKSEIADRYGIALSRAQQSELDYPAEPPGSGKRTYGSTIFESKDGKQRVIVLTGSDGRLQLKGGEELKELPRKDQDR